MSLKNIKLWYTYEDAIKRISDGLNEKINGHDLIQFLIHYNLPAYWYISNLTAVEIKKEDRLVENYENPFGTKNLLLNNGKLEEIDLSNKDFIHIGYFAQKDFVIELNGFYKIDNTQKINRDWLMRLYHFKDYGLDFSLDGIRVFDLNGIHYELRERIQDFDELKEVEKINPHLEHSLTLLNKLLAKQLEEKTGEKFGIGFNKVNESREDKHFHHLDHYCPYIIFPDITELHFFNKDIEQFIVKFTEITKETKKHTHKTEKTDLKILGAILNTTIKRGEKRKNPLFSSQSEIINEVIELYPNVSGLSKRTLETRFSEAKKALSEE